MQRQGPEDPGAQAWEAVAASVEDLEAVSAAVVGAVVEAVVGAVGLVEAKLRTRSGSQLPSWAVWSRT